MHPDLVVTRPAAHVAAITMRRPPNNFFDTGLVAGIADAIDEADVQDGCRAVILRSEGKHFCAGALIDPDRGDDSDQLYRAAQRLVSSPLPVVAAVQGAAVGGGLGLAMTADVRIASTRARLTANFVKLGIHHGFGLSATLPWAIGPHRAALLLSTGRDMSGAEAAAIGLCDAVVEPDDLDGAALEVAVSYANVAPLALRSIRQTMRADLVTSFPVALRREQTEQRRLATTDDHREGLAAIRERRPAAFTGT